MAPDADLPDGPNGMARPDGPNEGADGAAGDAAMLADISDELWDAVRRAVPDWVRRSVERRLADWGAAPDALVRAATEDAAGAATADVTARLRALLDADVDAQATNPLAVLRSAVRYPTAVLRGAGVPPVVRDAFAERAFPDDVYDLAPASFSDVDPALHEPGLRWGAAKAHVVLARRRAEGRR